MKKQKLNIKRRNFIKFLFFGGLSLILGGFLTRIFGIAEDESKYALPLRKFKVLEKDTELIFYSREGRKLFTLTDEGDLELS